MEKTTLTIRVLDRLTFQINSAVAQNHLISKGQAHQNAPELILGILACYYSADQEVSKDDLLGVFWNRRYFKKDDAKKLDGHICNLRKWLKSFSPDLSSLVETTPTGYRLNNDSILIKTDITLLREMTRKPTINAVEFYLEYPGSPKFESIFGGRDKISDLKTRCPGTYNVLKRLCDEAGENYAACMKKMTDENSNLTITTEQPQTLELSHKIPSKLPPLPDILLSRETILPELKNKIPDNGIVVLKGEGGMGKTTLTYQLAHDLYDERRFFGGVIWIDCQIIQTYDKCLRIILDVLYGHRFEDKSAYYCEQQFIEYARQSPTFIILDNFDTMIDNKEIKAWLQNIKSVASLLLTTQVIPSDLVKGQNAIFAPDLKLSRNDAIELFLELAGDDQELANQIETISCLCADVGYSPLAIECLARTKTLPIEDMRLSLQDNIELLGSCDAAIRISYERLNEPAKNLLQLVSIFPDGISRAALHQIEHWPLIESLVGGVSLGRRDKDRYTIHELIRKFALGQLGAHRAETERKAVTMMSSLLQEKINASGVRPLQERNTWIKCEWYNLMACARLAFQHEAWDAVGDIAEGVREFILTQGYWRDFQETYLFGFGNKPSVENRGYAQGMYVLGITYDIEGDNLDASIKCLILCRDIQQEIGDVDGLLATYNSLAVVRTTQFDKKEKIQFLEQAEEDCCCGLNLAKDESKNNATVGKIWSELGAICRRREKWEEAKKAFDSAITCLEQLDTTEAKRVEASTFRRIGDLHRDSQGDYAQAERFYNQSYRMYDEHGNPIGKALVLKSMAKMHEGQGKLNEAILNYGRARQLLDSNNDILNQKMLSEIEESLDRLRKESVDESSLLPKKQASKSTNSRSRRLR